MHDRSRIEEGLAMAVLLMCELAASVALACTVPAGSWPSEHADVGLKNEIRRVALGFPTKAYPGRNSVVADLDHRARSSMYY
jgi:hypothetical protein